jgi:hypothetical protein
MASDSDTTADAQEVIKHIQHRWKRKNEPALDRIERAKNEQYSMTWQQMLTFAAIVCEQADPQLVDQWVGEAARTLE